MVFYNLLNKQIVISRLTAVSGDKTAYSTLTVDYGSIHRMSDEKSAMFGGALGKTYRLYVDENCDILKGDKLIDEDGEEYKVKAVVIPAELGSFIHKECVVIRTG